MDKYSLQYAQKKLNSCPALLLYCSRKWKSKHRMRKAGRKWTYTKTPTERGQKHTDKQTINRLNSRQIPTNKVNLFYSFEQDRAFASLQISTYLETNWLSHNWATVVYRKAVKLHAASFSQIRCLLRTQPFNFAPLCCPDVSFSQHKKILNQIILHLLMHGLHYVVNSNHFRSQSYWAPYCQGFFEP